MVLKILHNYKHATSIFDDFIHYEKRQEEDEVRKPTPKVKIISLWISEKLLRFHSDIILYLCRTRQMIEEEEKTEEIRTDVMVVAMTETIGEEMTDVTIEGTTEGIIETVIENMEEGAGVIIIGEVENSTVTIVVRMVSAMGIVTVIVTVLQEKQVKGGGEETEGIGVDMVTEGVGEAVGVVVEEENKASRDL